ncbi:hypothetical protein FGO68_gene10062 [Halteria grandinella]|uniref:Uncharacterized protein n=1 Tax=Halteria grandinella TaxID=5974 RepID=A0A8J8P2M3_HALGN|nr:hypothetical protein FGO68_gene10062 [Halteria grandinella]
MEAINSQSPPQMIINGLRKSVTSIHLSRQKSSFDNFNNIRDHHQSPQGDKAILPNQISIQNQRDYYTSKNLSLMREQEIINLKREEERRYRELVRIESMKGGQFNSTKKPYEGMEVSSKAMVLNESPIRGMTRAGDPTPVGRMMSNSSLGEMFSITPTKLGGIRQDDSKKKEQYQGARPSGFQEAFKSLNKMSFISNHSRSKDDMNESRGSLKGNKSNQMQGGSNKKILSTDTKLRITHMNRNRDQLQSHQGQDLRGDTVMHIPHINVNIVPNGQGSDLNHILSGKREKVKKNQYVKVRLNNKALEQASSGALPGVNGKQQTPLKITLGSKLRVSPPPGMSEAQLKKINIQMENPAYKPLLNASPTPGAQFITFPQMSHVFPSQYYGSQIGGIQGMMSLNTFQQYQRQSNNFNTGSQDNNQNKVVLASQIIIPLSIQQVDQNMRNQQLDAIQHLSIGSTLNKLSPLPEHIYFDDSAESISQRSHVIPHSSPSPIIPPQQKQFVALNPQKFTFAQDVLQDSRNMNAFPGTGQFMSTLHGRWRVNNQKQAFDTNIVYNGRKNFSRESSHTEQGQKLKSEHNSQSQNNLNQNIIIKKQPHQASLITLKQPSISSTGSQQAMRTPQKYATSHFPGRPQIPSIISSNKNSATMLNQTTTDHDDNKSHHQFSPSVSSNFKRSRPRYTDEMIANGQQGTLQGIVKVPTIFNYQEKKFSLSKDALEKRKSNSDIKMRNTGPTSAWPFQKQSPIISLKSIPPDSGVLKSMQIRNKLTLNGTPNPETSISGNKKLIISKPPIGPTVSGLMTQPKNSSSNLVEKSPIQAFLGRTPHQLALEAAKRNSALSKTQNLQAQLNNTGSNGMKIQIIGNESAIGKKWRLTAGNFFRATNSHLQKMPISRENNQFNPASKSLVESLKRISEDQRFRNHTRGSRSSNSSVSFISMNSSINLGRYDSAVTRNKAGLVKVTEMEKQESNGHFRNKSYSTVFKLGRNMELEQQKKESALKLDPEAKYLKKDTKKPRETKATSPVVAFWPSAQNVQIVQGRPQTTNQSMMTGVQSNHFLTSHHTTSTQLRASAGSQSLKQRTAIINTPPVGQIQSISPQRDQYVGLHHAQSQALLNNSIGKKNVNQLVNSPSQPSNLFGNSIQIDKKVLLIRKEDKQPVNNIVAKIKLPRFGEGKHKKNKSSATMHFQSSQNEGDETFREFVQNNGGLPSFGMPL